MLCAFMNGTFLWRGFNGLPFSHRGKVCGRVGLNLTSELDFDVADRGWLSGQRVSFLANLGGTVARMRCSFRLFV